MGSLSITTGVYYATLYISSATQYRTYQYLIEEKQIIPTTTTTMVAQAKGLGLAGLLTNILLVSLSGLLLSHHQEINDQIDQLVRFVSDEARVASGVAAFLVVESEEEAEVMKRGGPDFYREKIETASIMVLEKLKQLHWGQNVEEVGEIVKYSWSLLGKAVLGAHTIYLLNDLLLVIGLFSSLHCLLLPWIIVSSLFYVLAAVLTLLGLGFKLYILFPSFEMHCWCVSAIYLAVFAVHVLVLYKVWMQSLVVQVMARAYKDIKKKKNENSGQMITNIVDGYGDKVFLIGDKE